jgi:hypothetical protein
LKWAVSIVVSMFGSAVALYIFRGKMRAHADLLARVDAELSRRVLLPDRKPGEVHGGEPPLDGEGRDSK